MLPLTYFERLANTRIPKSFPRCQEQRVAIRIPRSVYAELVPITGEHAGHGRTVRLKDVSSSGVGFLIPPSIRPTLTFILGINPRQFETHWLACQLRRAYSPDGVARIIGASWQRILYPGQDICAGVRLSDLLWLEVEGADAPEDPFQEILSTGIHSRFR